MPGPVPPPAVDQAMGRYDGGAVGAAAQSPDLAARQAFQEASQRGEDGIGAAVQAWMQALIALSQRLQKDNYQPTDPSEANLAMLVKKLVDQGMNPNAATGVAHEFLASQARQAGAGAPAGVPGAAPPGGSTPPPPQMPPMMGA